MNLQQDFNTSAASQSFSSCKIKIHSVFIEFTNEKGMFLDENVTWEWMEAKNPPWLEQFSFAARQLDKSSWLLQMTAGHIDLAAS